MDTKEVEAGKKYVFELLAVAGGDKFAVFETPTGCPVTVPQEEAEALYPVKGSLGTTPAPKYDPNRKFRKGDKVKAVLRHGRIPNDGVPKDVILEVIADERDGVVKVLHKMGVILEIFNVYALFLELVTPVEDPEPYVVRLATPDGVEEWHVEPRNNNLALVAVFGHSHPNAKAAAEAECARLNAEWKKEMEV